MSSRYTTDAQAALAARTPQDLAAALHSRRAGNTATVWIDPHPGSPPAPASPSPDFDPALKAVLERSAQIAMASGAQHIGTEHLLAALVRTSDVAPWLAERGATTEAVDALLANLAGGLGAESVTAKPSLMDRLLWNAGRSEAQGKRSGLSTTFTVVLVVVVVVIVLALCIWSGP